MKPAGPNAVRVLLLVGLLSLPGVSLAGFAGTDVFVPAVARVSGAGGSEFFSTVWITNVSSATASVQMDLLLQGQPNPTPQTRADSVPAGVTRRYDDIVGTLFGVSGKGAALRIRSDQELLVSSRTYDRPPGLPLKDTKGLFFAGIRGDLAIGLGEKTQLQGISTASAEAFRYNFGIVETSGQPVTVQVSLRNEFGGALSTPQQYSLGAYEARQVNEFLGFTPAPSTSNAVLEAQVTSGTGKVLVYGTQVAGTSNNPGSNDSSGFEMRFRSSQSVTAGVTSVNGQSGDIVVQQGTNATVTTSGKTITISGVQGPAGPPGPKGDAGTSGLNAALVSGGIGSVVAQKPAGWISGVTKLAPGNYRLDVASDVFAARPICTCSTTIRALFCVVSGDTATSITAKLWDASANTIDDTFSVMCTSSQ